MDDELNRLREKGDAELADLKKEWADTFDRLDRNQAELNRRLDAVQDWRKRNKTANI